LAGYRDGFSSRRTCSFCAAAPLVAGAYTLQLLNSLFPSFVTTDAANNNWLIAVVGIAWLLFVTFMVVRGIRITANFQWILVFIEYLIVLGFAIAAFVKIAGGHSAATPVSGSWFNPTSLHDLSTVGYRVRPRRVLLLGLGHRRQRQRGVPERQRVPRAGGHLQHVHPAVHLPGGGDGQCRHFSVRRR